MEERGGQSDDGSRRSKKSALDGATPQSQEKTKHDLCGVKVNAEDGHKFPDSPECAPPHEIVAQPIIGKNIENLPLHELRKISEAINVVKRLEAQPKKVTKSRR